MQTQRTVCKTTTPTRNHHERYRDEDVWKTILPRGDPTNDTVGARCKQRALFARKCARTIPARGTVTNDTVTHQNAHNKPTPLWHAKERHHLRGVPTNDTVGLHQTHTPHTKKNTQQESQKDDTQSPSAHEEPVTIRYKARLAHTKARIIQVSTIPPVTYFLTSPNHYENRTNTHTILTLHDETNSTLVKNQYASQIDYTSSTNLYLNSYLPSQSLSMTRRSQWVSTTSLVTSLPVWVQEVNRQKESMSQHNIPWQWVSTHTSHEKSRHVRAWSSMMIKSCSFGITCWYALRFPLTVTTRETSTITSVSKITWYKRGTSKSCDLWHAWVSHTFPRRAIPRVIRNVRWLMLVWKLTHPKSDDYGISEERVLPKSHCMGVSHWKQVWGISHKEHPCGWARSNGEVRYSGGVSPPCITLEHVMCYYTVIVT